MIDPRTHTVIIKRRTESVRADEAHLGWTRIATRMSDGKVIVSHHESPQAAIDDD